MLCPICDIELIRNGEIPEIKDHSITGETFELLKCPKCQILKTCLTDIRNLGKYYASTDYISHGGNSINPMHLLYKAARVFTLNQKRRLLEGYETDKRILDFGCGTGHFLKEMKKSGWDIFGVEPSEKARNIATTILNQQIRKEAQEVAETFPLITAWHVLEHTTNPVETTEELKKKLGQTGRIIIAVPNYASEDSNHYREYWAGYDVPRHLWHFSPVSIQMLADKTNLTLEERIPMKLDAYYVSLLSEKYINHNKLGAAQAYNALKQGYASNKRAKQTGNFSSLIYILRK